MSIIFEILDKTGRKIHLSQERWKHIRIKHPEVEDPEMIKETLGMPDKITDYRYEYQINYYYKYYKNRSSPEKFLLVVVKYLNDHGFVLSPYFEDKIK